MTEERGGNSHESGGVEDVITLLRQSAADESLPDGIGGVDSDDGGTDEDRGKAAHAFKSVKGQLKTAVGVIDQQREHIRQLEEERRSGSGGEQKPSPPAIGGTPASKESAIIQGLKIQAMRNLGIQSEEEAPKTMEMEVQRLWSQHVASIEERHRAKSTAATVVEDELSKITAFGHLDESGKETVRSRIKELDVMQQVSPPAIRNVVAQYLGELQLAGNSVDAGSGNGSPAPSHPPMGTVKSRGSGVRPGAGANRGKESSEPKPLTPEERAEMDKLGLKDEKAYRAAKDRKSKYKGR